MIRNIEETSNIFQISIRTSPSTIPTSVNHFVPDTNHCDGFTVCKHYEVCHVQCIGVSAGAVLSAVCRSYLCRESLDDLQGQPGQDAITGGHVAGLWLTWDEGQSKA